MAQPAETKAKPGKGAAAAKVKTEPGTASGTETTTKRDVTPPSEPVPEGVEFKEPENPVPQEEKSEEVEEAMPKRNGTEGPKNPVPQEVKPGKIDKSISEKVEEVKPKRNETEAEPGTAPSTQSKTKTMSEVKPQKTAKPVPHSKKFEEVKPKKSEAKTEPGTALIAKSEMGTPSEVKLENTDNPAVGKFKPKKTGKPVSEAPPVVSTAASEQGSEASDLSGLAENPRPKTDEGGKQDTDHFAEVFPGREQPGSGDTKPTEMPEEPMGSLQTRMSWASGVGTESEYETAQEDESTSEEEPSVQGSRRSSISTDDGSDMEISVHEASSSSQVKWEVAEDDDTECEKPEEGTEEEKITKPLEVKAPDNGCDVAQGQWQSGPVYPAMVAVDLSQKGSRADDEIAPRADGADGFLNISKGWIIAPPTVTVLVGERAEERTKYLGELFVSDG